MYFFFIADTLFISVLCILKSAFINKCINLVSFCCFAARFHKPVVQKQLRTAETEGFRSSVGGCNWH